MSNITPHYRSVSQLLQNQSFSIDEYQREYKWGRKNIEELLSDLSGKFFSSYKDRDDTRNVSSYEEYFLGSIIISKRNGRNYLVDGQQRVTSLTLLLIYLYRNAHGQGLPVTQTIAPLIFSDNMGEPKFNLDITERLPVIEALFNGREFSPDGRDESIQTMYARYKDIEDIDLIDSLGDALPHFTYWLMQKVGLIEIATDNDSYAYAIFETMNDRGKPLSPVDMLKAYLLAPIADADRRRLANQEWRKQTLELISSGGDPELERDANCIKAWLRSQYAETIRERRAGSVDKDWELIGTIFHRWIRDNRTRLNLGTERTNLDMMTSEFPFFAKAYGSIQKASNTYTKGWEAVFYNAHNDFTWQNTVLLAPLIITDDDETVRKKIAVTATYLDIWVMRQVVNYFRVGYSNVNYAMWVLCKEIRRKSLAELTAILLEKLNRDDVTFDGAPTKGRNGINGFYLNQFSRRYIFHILSRLTAYIDASSGRADLFDNYVDRNKKNPFDIEHVWANRPRLLYKELGFDSQSDFEGCRDHIGSLLLLPADVNRSLQDKDFSYKSSVYARQNFYAASFSHEAYKHQPQFQEFRTTQNLPFKPYEYFGIEEQLERTELLKSLMNIVWSPERLMEVAD